MNADRTEEEIGFQVGYDRATYGVCRQDLDAMGERAVRDALNSGKWGHAGLSPFEFVSAWLKDAEFVRLAADSAKRDAREEETLSIARSAVAISERAERRAKWANIIAIAAIVFSAAIAISAAFIDRGSLFPDHHPQPGSPADSGPAALRR